MKKKEEEKKTENAPVKKQNLVFVFIYVNGIKLAPSTGKCNNWYLSL